MCSMSKPTSTISSAVSIRISNDLLDSIREYAIAHNLINNSGRPDKRGEPNLSQAFSELVRLGLGQEITVSDSVINPTNNDLRDTVTKLSDSVLILSDKLEESESSLEAVLNQVEDLRLKVHSQETYSLLYDHLKADVDIRFDATNKAIAALTNKASSESSSAPKTEGSSLEPDAVASIEVIASTDGSTVSIKLPGKEVVEISPVETLNDETGINSHEAFAIAQQRGYKGKYESFRSRFEKQNLGTIYHLKRIPHKRGKENWLYFDTRSEIQS